MPDILLYFREWKEVLDTVHVNYMYKETLTKQMQGKYRYVWLVTLEIYILSPQDCSAHQPWKMLIQIEKCRVLGNMFTNLIFN